MVSYIGWRFEGIIVDFIAIPLDLILYLVCRLVVAYNVVDDELISSVFVHFCGETSFSFGLKQKVTVMRTDWSCCINRDGICNAIAVNTQDVVSYFECFKTSFRERNWLIIYSKIWRSAQNRVNGGWIT